MAFQKIRKIIIIIKNIAKMKVIIQRNLSIIIEEKVQKRNLIMKLL